MSRDRGVVLVHGKWASPPFEHAPLAARLVSHGYAIREPLMPWSLRRLYDVTFEQALDELDQSVGELRQAGCRHVTICGHSLGACAALGLVARRGGADALILLAPGHFPERLAADQLTTPSLNLARQALAAGDERRIALTDCNQGISRHLRIRPEAYLSYFEPQGPAQWPANARAIAEPLPVLLVVGRQDSAHAAGIDYAFALTPHHSSSKYVDIDASHSETPARATDIVLDWMAAIATDSPP